jgi:predicted flap endonuclease-1-like 5' DNA nuclease
LAIAGAIAGREPFASWLYPLTWYPTLLLMDAAVASRGGRSFLFGRPAFLATALGWSIPFWLFFELLNLRLENWHYVFLPRDPSARWAGIALSFATVIPAVLLAERLLGSVGLARNAGVRPLRISSRVTRALQAVGVLMLLLPLAWPRVFFPLVWGGVLLIVDPWVRARDPARSLLGDLERGDPGRIVRLLAGGLGIGVLWEAFNVAARGKWIYTVPGFEDLKLFEMPVLGFLGFPFFALEAFAVWQALVVAGLAVPAEGRVASPPSPRIAAAALLAAGCAALLAAGFTAVMIAAMHRHTIASLAPVVSDFGAPTAHLRAVGIDDPWELAEADPGRVAAATGAEEGLARAWVERAGVATLRGIGAPNAARLAELGVGTVAALAEAEPDRLGTRLAAGGTPIDSARLRVWVGAARDAGRRGATRPSS